MEYVVPGTGRRVAMMGQSVAEAAPHEASADPQDVGGFPAAVFFVAPKKMLQKTR